jgi:cytochrome c oxidase subunit 1
MLRRALYLNGEFNLFMVLAGICGAFLLLAFLAFLYNIVMTVGLNGAIGIFRPAKIRTKELVPTAA